ncbi:unnamed protein product [Toxocara canis]|uniref:E3 UFM1-protein ligase 1 homolog n=1 Tax=Toxocara canis TaxID=6265 RepID=A0A183UWB3_TOXCA|nr:unnamed protein product [Toxocara canis]
MTTTWADIQRLAADLQRVQLAEGAKKLSEKNCVEVVSMLMASKAIDIVFTSDGHAYLTKKHLLTEIKNECIGRGGRVSLSELAHTLNVDYEHIENSVAIILKQSSSFVLCNAELVSRDYVDLLCKELNERLSETGVLSISQLAKSWDLPSEILNGLVLIEIGNKVDAMRDGDAIYTRAYLSAQSRLLRAMLIALTKVTPVAKLTARLNLSPSIFWSLYDELVDANEDVLPKTEYASLVFFPSAVVSNKLWEEIELSIKNDMEKQCYCDVGTHMLAAISSHQDVEKAISICVKSSKEWMSVSGQPFIYTAQLLSNALKAVDGLINDRAENEAQNLGKQQKIMKKQEKPQDEEWAAVKGKKGRGGKGKGGKQAPKEESAPTSSYRIPREELINELERVSTIPPELLDEVAEQISQNAETMLRTRIEALLRTVQTISAQDQKRAHLQLQEKLRALYNNICIFEQATNSFDESVATDLRSYLIRTLCTDVANIVLSFVSGTENVNTLSPKIREETISGIENAESREAVALLFSSLSNADLDAFHSAISDISSPAVCSLNLRMPDKKQRAELVEAYAAELEHQLRVCEDPAAGLLIALLVILARRYSIAVHASGKFVSHLILKVEKVVDCSSELNELLTSMQKLVVAVMKNKSNVEMKTKLNEKLKSMKILVLGAEVVEESSKDGGVEDGELVEVKS